MKVLLLVAAGVRAVPRRCRCRGRRVQRPGHPGRGGRAVLGDRLGRHRRGQVHRPAGAPRTPTSMQLVDVYTGGGADEPLQICCGAFNMAVGDLVPLATLGTTMPGGMLIERRKLRGEWSNGMLCSTRELGLGDDHGGIRILDGALAPGYPAGRGARCIESDVLFELEVNPNRPDAMSVAGLARDLAAKLDLPFTPARPDPDDDRRGAADGRRGRDRRSRAVRPLRRVGAPRRHGGGVPRLDAAAPHRARHAPDQRPGRHLQLRDARAGPAQPSLRPGPGRRRGLAVRAGAATASGWSPSTTSSAPSRWTTY